MLENNYTEAIFAIAKKRLEDAQNPFTQKELCRNIVSVIRKQLGKTGVRHSSKVRFGREIPPFVLNHALWQDVIISTKEKNKN